MRTRRRLRYENAEDRAERGANGEGRKRVIAHLAAGAPGKANTLGAGVIRDVSRVSRGSVNAVAHRLASVSQRAGDDPVRADPLDQLGHGVADLVGDFFFEVLAHRFLLGARHQRSQPGNVRGLRLCPAGQYDTGIGGAACSIWYWTIDARTLAAALRSDGFCPRSPGARSARSCFFDHAGPVTFPAGIPRSLDVRPHPHIGLATVSYLFEGEITHRDSLGVTQEIHPGAVNWMIAGRGITHSERFETIRAKGGTLHLIQAWVGLPTEDEEMAPDFAHHPAATLPTYEGGGLRARLIAGEGFGAKSPVKTLSPLFYAHWELAAGASAQLPAEYPERAAYIAAGEVEVENQTYSAGKMLVFKPGEPVTFKAVTACTIMLLGGEPIGKRFVEWNFVSSSKDRLEQAKADWRAGRMKLPDADDKEFIPLPEPPPPPNPLS